MVLICMKNPGRGKPVSFQVTVDANDRSTKMTVFGPVGSMHPSGHMSGESHADGRATCSTRLLVNCRCSALHKRRSVGSLDGHRERNVLVTSLKELSRYTSKRCHSACPEQYPSPDTTAARTRQPLEDDRKRGKCKSTVKSKKSNHRLTNHTRLRHCDGSFNSNYVLRQK